MDMETFTETQGNSQPLRNDFFKPLNEMDPMVKKGEVSYDFQCKLFNMGNPEHVSDYRLTVNLCLSKDAIMGIKQTHFTKEGDMLIYMEWMKIIAPKKATTEVAAEKKEENKDAAAVAKVKEIEAQARQKKRERKAKSHITNDPRLPLDLEDSMTLKLEDM